MKRTILCFIIMIIVYLFEYVLSSTSNNSVDWDYRDEGNTLFDWIDEWPECGYNYQSPINIDLIDCDDKDDEPIYLEWSHHTQHYAVRYDIYPSFIRFLFYLFQPNLTQK